MTGRPTNARPLSAARRRVGASAVPAFRTIPPSYQPGRTVRIEPPSAFSAAALMLLKGWSAVPGFASSPLPAEMKYSFGAPCAAVVVTSAAATINRLNDDRNLRIRQGQDFMNTIRQIEYRMLRSLVRDAGKTLKRRLPESLRGFC